MPRTLSAVPKGAHQFYFRGRLRPVRRLSALFFVDSKHIQRGPSLK